MLMARFQTGLVPTMNAALEADQGPVRLSRTRPQVEL